MAREAAVLGERAFDARDGAGLIRWIDEREAELARAHRYLEGLRREAELLLSGQLPLPLPPHDAGAYRGARHLRLVK